jgi:3'(2'), 5'-bisphosphate nucleotidase
MNRRLLMGPLCDIAIEAGEAILRVYRTEFEVRRKEDQSPVTDADLAAEAVITSALARLSPGVPVVSEEALPEKAMLAPGERFWLVDPLDGTREFVRRSDEFTVNIALIEAARPVLGVICAPALSQLYVGAVEEGTYEVRSGQRLPIACRVPPAAGLAVITSRWHSDSAPWKELLNGRLVASHETMGSSLKFAVVAAGRADAYPRHGRTREWDTAAGQAILTAAGGRVTDAGGTELAYGKPAFLNPAFIAMGRPA